MSLFPLTLLWIISLRFSCHLNIFHLLAVTPFIVTHYSDSDTFLPKKELSYTNKVQHNGSADQASDHTIKDFQDGKDDAAAAVIQKSWRTHTERKMKNELTSRGVPQVLVTGGGHRCWSQLLVTANGIIA